MALEILKATVADEHRKLSIIKATTRYAADLKSIIKRNKHLAVFYPFAMLLIVSRWDVGERGY